MSKTKKKVLIATISVLSVIVLGVSAFFIYIGTHYHADDTQISAYLATKENVTCKDLGDALIFSGEEKKAGIVFYQGANVEHTAYSPLMCALASYGYLCVIVKMPLYHAFFKPNIASDYVGMDGVNHWYIAGHSLGGSIAAQYADSHTDKLDGVILLASFSTNNLSNSGLKVLSIYGSEDRVLNGKSYERTKKNLPADFTEYVIDGGCHSYFGMYGMQRGDGAPTISNVEQIELTASKIAEFVEGNLN